MARSSSVEYSQVAQACYRLFQAGDPVSFQRVYDLLDNKGSSRVVNEYMRRWRQEAGDKLAVSFSRGLPAGLPDALVTATDDLLVKLWQSALDCAEQSYQAAAAELVTLRDQLQAERQQEQAQILAQTTRIAVLEGELKALQATLADRESALEASISARQALDASLATRDVQLAGLREELARLTAAFEAGQRQHAADLLQAQARSEELLAAARQNHNQELAQAREVAAGERAYLMKTTDEIRQAAKLTETQLKEENASLKTMGEAYRSQVYQARDDAARWKGRAESAEALVQRLTSKRQKPGRTLPEANTP